MKSLILLATLALAACSTGDPMEDARISNSLAILAVGANNYGSALTAASYQPTYRSTVCYPVGRSVMCQ